MSSSRNCRSASCTMSNTSRRKPDWPARWSYLGSLRTSSMPVLRGAPSCGCRHCFRRTLSSTRSTMSCSIWSVSISRRLPLELRLWLSSASRCCCRIAPSKSSLFSHSSLRRPGSDCVSKSRGCIRLRISARTWCLTIRSRSFLLASSRVRLSWRSAVSRACSCCARTRCCSILTLSRSRAILLMSEEAWGCGAVLRDACRDLDRSPCLAPWLDLGG